MKAKYFPSMKKTVLPEDITSEVEDIASNELLEHGLGTNFKYYVLIEVESELEIIQYDVKGVPEETVEKFSEMLEDLKIKNVS